MKDDSYQPNPRTPIYRYFAGMAENTFQSQLGVVDPPLIDYVTDLLIRSIRSDMVHRIRSVTGRPLMSIQEMVAEASERWVMPVVICIGTLGISLCFGQASTRKRYALARQVWLTNSTPTVRSASGRIESPVRLNRLPRMHRRLWFSNG